MRWKALGTILLVGLAGCPNPKPGPVPAPPGYTKVILQITDPNKVNPCPVSNPCEANYVLTDNGITIATLTVGTKTYTLTPLPTKGMHTYSMVVNGKNALGNPVSAATTVTVVIP